MEIIPIGLNAAHTIWTEFRTNYPNSNQEFTTNPSRLKVWSWMNMAASRRPKHQVIHVDNSLLLAIRAKYRVTEFSGLPFTTQIIYEQIAACFPGSQVYACGSRVRGDYIDIDWQQSDEIVMEARKKAGLKFRQKSDFDFWVEPGAEQKGKLPANCDRCRLRVPENEKIPIPIYE